MIILNKTNRQKSSVKNQPKNLDHNFDHTSEKQFS